MSIWTCNAAAVALALGTLTGCSGGFGSAAEVTQTRVSGGGVTVAGPPGFCIDREASEPMARPAFVLMASCATVLRDINASRPRRNALLTASVADAPSAPTGAELSETLAQYFSTEAGRASVARSAKAEHVTILDVQIEDGGLSMFVRDESPNPPNIQTYYWRGVYAVNGRLLTAAAMGYAAQPLGRDDAQALLARFVTATRAASQGATVQAAAEPGSEATVSEEKNPLSQLLSLTGLRR